MPAALPFAVCWCDRPRTSATQSGRRLRFSHNNVAEFEVSSNVPEKSHFFVSPKTCVDIKVKLNCTLVQAHRLCTGRMTYSGSRGIALPFHDHGTRRGWGVSVKPRPLFTSGKNPVHIVQETVWAPGPVWTGAENLAPTEIRSPDRPARS